MCDKEYKYCKNCNTRMDEEDEYCAECGMLYGLGHYSPDEISGISGIAFACVYGPPPKKRIHKCTKCNYTWNNFALVNSVRYCPKCGGYAETIVEEY